VIWVTDDAQPAGTDHLGNRRAVKAPAILRTAAMDTANFGDRTRVETEVALHLRNMVPFRKKQGETITHSRVRIMHI
jgi:hypothetical protein